MNWNVCPVQSTLSVPPPVAPKHSKKLLARSISAGAATFFRQCSTIAVELADAFPAGRFPPRNVHADPGIALLSRRPRMGGRKTIRPFLRKYHHARCDEPCDGSGRSGRSPDGRVDRGGAKLWNLNDFRPGRFRRPQGGWAFRIGLPKQALLPIRPEGTFA